jgi:hypothetical protein
MLTPNLAKIVKALVDNPDDDPIQIVRDSGGEGLSKEQPAIVFEMSVAEFLAQAEEWQQEAEQARAAAQLFEGLPNVALRFAKTPNPPQQYQHLTSAETVLLFKSGHSSAMCRRHHWNNHPGA